MWSAAAMKCPTIRKSSRSMRRAAIAAWWECSTVKTDRDILDSMAARSLIGRAIAFTALLGASVAALFVTADTTASAAGTTAAAQCRDTAGATDNPNKFLFVSCGGFLD